MNMPFHLGLRDDRHIVGVVKLNGSTRDQLGRAYPEDSQSRRRVLAQWGIDDSSPRRANPETIDIPLSRRAQAILSYQVDASLRERLATGVSFGRTRADTDPGMRERVHLGGHEGLPTSFRRGRHVAPLAVTPAVRARQA